MQLSKKLSNRLLMLLQPLNSLAQVYTSSTDCQNYQAAMSSKPLIITPPYNIFNYEKIQSPFSNSSYKI